MQNLLTTPAEAKAILAKLIALGFNPTAIGRERTEPPWDGPIFLTELDKEAPEVFRQFGFVFEAIPSPGSTMLNAAAVRDTILNRPNTSADLRWQMIFQQVTGSWDPGAFAEFKAGVGAVKTMTDQYAVSILGGQA